MVTGSGLQVKKYKGEIYLHSLENSAVICKKIFRACPMKETRKSVPSWVGLSALHGSRLQSLT